MDCATLSESKDKKPPMKPLTNQIFCKFCLLHSPVVPNPLVSPLLAREDAGQKELEKVTKSSQLLQLVRVWFNKDQLFQSKYVHSYQSFCLDPRKEHHSKYFDIVPLLTIDMRLIDSRKPTTSRAVHCACVCSRLSFVSFHDTTPATRSKWFLLKVNGSNAKIKI